MRQFVRHLLMGVFAVSALCGADWRQFRGTSTTGLADGASAPTSWSDSEHIAWKVPLDGEGLSGPIVIGSRVYLTASSGPTQNRLHVYAFDAATGERVWERKFWATGSTMCHESTSVAAPTPTSDGERIFAMFSSGDLACLDLDGNLLWYRALLVDYPNASNSLGLASSPIVSGATLVVQIEADADAHALGLDVATGETRWHLDRPKAANWTSPVVIPGDGGDGELVLLQSSKGVDAVLPATGEIAWSYKDGAGTIPSSAAADGLVFVPSNGLTALRPNKASETPEVVWRESTLGPGTPSAFAFDGSVYVVNGTGVLKSASAEDGKVKWQLRLGGKISSTPVSAGGKLYFFDHEGNAQVVEPGEKKGTIVGEGKLGEEILCTPAIADGAIYVRSNSHLWKIAE